MEECDLVMKGGVTSGAVYPKAISHLAEHYRFVSIGGTSAGAIAAAAAAAAEYQRQVSPNKDSRQGFAVLDDLPRRLGAPGTKNRATLLQLFQPQRELKPLFWFMLSFIGSARTKKGTAREKRLLQLSRLMLLGRLCFNAIRHFWGWAALGAIASVGIARLLGFSVDVWWRWLPLIVFVFAGSFVATLYGIWRAVLKLPANNFGMCRGFEGPLKGKEEDVTQLTSWLYALLQEVAGRKPSDPPLTFGDLLQQKIDFRAVTSNLSYGYPHRLPFNEGEAWPFFKEEEWALMFPHNVIEHLKNKPLTNSDHAYVEVVNQSKRDHGLLPLPGAKELPIIVAVRLSLSFPVLLSATPIYFVDPAAQAAGPKKCWLSDGGLSSNFPLHFFDSPIPTRPTFAINLEEVPSFYSGERVFLADTNAAGLARHWTEIKSADKQSALAGFFMGIFDIMQNWRDNSLLRLPGNRDRVATVRLKSHEGGLNLNMPTELIKALAEYGAQAADKLCLHFLPANVAACRAAGIQTTWENHRWIRLLSMLAGVDRLLADFEQAWPVQSPTVKNYDELLDPVKTTNPDLPSYKDFSSGQRRLALCCITELRRTIANCEATASGASVRENTPRPPMRYRLTSEF